MQGRLAAGIAGAASMIGARSKYRGWENRVNPPADGARLPPLVAFDLEGRRLELPADLGWTVGLFAYRQRHQDDVDTWLPELIRLADTHPWLDVIEFPTIEPFGAVGQEYLDRAMRAGIPDQEARRRTVTLYVEPASFNASLGLVGTEAIHVVLLDPSGRPVWQTNGPRTGTGMADLAGVVASSDPTVA